MRKPARFFEAIYTRLTLRRRIAFLTAGMALGLGIVLILFINFLAPYFVSGGVGIPDTMILVTATDLAGNPVTVMVETPGPPGSTVRKYVGIPPGDPLVVVRYLSVIGVVLIGVIGFFAAQWIARKALQPVNDVSRAAHGIDARTLGQRLDYRGARDEVQVLVDAFNRMLERLASNFKDQSEFNANLAHELRTPLASLRMNIEDLASTPDYGPEDVTEFLGVAARAVDRMERLVNDLLLLSKGETEIARQPVFLGVLFEEIIDELSPIAREREITLKMSGAIELAVRGDPTLLHRLVANLVENGIAYNRPGGSVEISARAVRDRAVIAVRDDGLGISKPQQARLFKRFSRDPATAGHHNGGRGLGLAIAAHIARLHHGEIRVESAPGQGSTFEVELPVLAEFARFF